jgi:hypothetical protein
MSETASDVVKDALFELTTQAQEEEIPAIELETGIRYLNRMMAALDATGIKLGYTRVDAPNDVLTVPAGAVEAIVFNLAKRLATSFDIAISPALDMNARTGMRTLRIIGVKPNKIAYPSTLPIGSGNEDGSGSISDQQFYPDCCEDENPCSIDVKNGDTNGL